MGNDVSVYGICAVYIIILFNDAEEEKGTNQYKVM